MALTTTKVFDRNLNAGDPVFPSVDGEPRMNIEGIVEVAGSDFNVDMTSVSGSYLVGKPAAATDGDFTTAWASATTITLGGYPAGITGFTHEDIEFVRQIDNAGGAIDGTVVATYSRDDCAMDIAGNTLTVTGAVFVGTDTFVIGTNIPRSSSATPSIPGGKSIYCNAADDFVATINNATKTITITALPFTLEAMHVVAGSIKKIDTSDVVTNVNLTDVSIAGGVITLANEGVNFVTGDEVVVTLVGPDKAYDKDLDTDKVTEDNPDYAHYTDVEHLVEEADLGIQDTATGTDGDTLTDTNHTLAGIDFDAEQVAVGYEAYSETTDELGTVNSITDGDEIETDAITNWTGDIYWLPECKRFEISMDSYKFMVLHWKIVSGDDNRATMKIYATLNEDADTTDDTDWIDLSLEVLGNALGIQSDGEAAAAIVTSEDAVIIDQPSMYVKWMIKIVGEVLDGGAGAAANQDFDVYIRKFY